MAANQINVGINVSSNGTTDKETKKAKGLKDMLDQAAASASRAGRAMAASRSGGAGGGGGGTPGSAEVMEYGRSRAVGVGTGASARDFANQAQGLGGLVRIYATLAANIFAATAAFGALSRAMDTTNMVRGLDQLGAASGTALGSLSKQLVTATDGAVSLREAMDATVKASSAGLNTDQILRLGQVSKTAAQALGLNMTDALSRLSRGISKLEPELLDELGIFVRIDDAVSKYALSVGKAATGLTDFERRQAFANAVLEQGERKFGEIDIATNPYTKLAAALQNLAQSGLEFVNKFLGPVAKLLADNSALLAGAVALIGTKLVGMAIPALSQWRQGLTKSAEDARDKAREINTAFGEAWTDRWEARLKLPELRAAVVAAKAEIVKLGVPAGLSQTVQDYYKTVASGTQISSRQQGYVNTLINDNKKAIENLGNSQDRQTKAAIAARQREIAQLEALIRLNKALKAASGPEAQFAAKYESVPSRMLKPFTDPREVVAERQATRAAALTALSMVSSDTLSQGFTGAIKNLNTQLNETGVKGVTKFTTLVRGGFAAAATTVGLFASALAGALSWIGLIVGAGAAVLNFFSNTEKQAKLTSEAFDRIEGAVHSATVTMERLKGLEDPLAFLSVEGIQARANAIGELADSLNIGLKRALDEINQMNWAAGTIDLFLGIFGKDVESKLAKNLSSGIKSAFETANAGPATDAARKKIEEILGESVSSAKLPDIVETLIETGQTDKLRQIVKEINKLGSEQRITAAKGTELKESIGAVSTSLKEFTNSLKPTDQLYKIADASTVSLNKLQAALQDPVQTINAMNTAVNSLDLLAAFPQDVALNLLSYKDRLSEINTELARAQPIADAYNKKVDELRNKIASMPEQAQAQRMYLIGELGRLLDQKPVEVDIVANIKAETSRLKSTFDKAFGEGMIANAELAAVRISAEFQKSRTLVSSALADQLGDTRAGIEIRKRLNKERIDSEMENTRASYNLSLTMDRLRIAVEQQELATRESSLKQEKAGNLGPVSTERAAEINRDLAKIANRNEQLALNMGFVEDVQAGRKPRSPKDVLDIARVTTSRIAGGTTIIPENIDKELLAQATKYQEFLAKVKTSTAQKQVVDITAELEFAKLLNKEQSEKLKQEGLILKAKQDTLALLDQTGALNSQEFDDLRNRTAIEQQDLEFRKEKLELQTKISAYEYAIKGLKGEGVEATRQALQADRASAQEALDNLETNNKRAKLIINLKDAEVGITKEVEKQRKEREYLATIDTLIEEKASSQLNYAKTLLDIQKSTNSLSAVDLQRAQSRLEIREAEAQEQKRIKDLEEARKTALEPLQKQRSVTAARVFELGAAGDLVSPEVLSFAVSQLEQVDNQVKLTNVEYDAQLKIIKQTLGINQEILKVKQRDALLVAQFQDQEERRNIEIEQGQLIRQGIEDQAELDRRRVELMKENGTITEDVYNSTVRGLEITKREREFDNKQLEITNRYLALRNKLELDRKRVEEFGPMSPEERTRFDERSQVLETGQRLELGNLNRVREGYRLLDKEIVNLSERQKGYMNVFEGSFNKMGDAIVSFAETGKFVFKDFANSVLQDILRMETKMLTSQVWGALRSSIIGAFTGGGFDPTMSAGTNGITVSAKGNAFGYSGMERFAKGGMFTNSIVDNPTIFKFAKGVGMMGEAGPEAIMPLKRDSSGNLGVRAQGGNTEVIVNNYSNQPAEAREVVDSRGNRRVEVTVGDMVAGELGKTTSRTTRAVSGTFGLRPQLIRR